MIKNPLRTLICSLLFGLLLLSGPAGAQSPLPEKDPSLFELSADVPAKITYQGMLKENNIPVSGTRSMTFSFHGDAACSTAALAVTGPADIPVSSGLFTTQLNVPTSLFSGSSIWVKTAAGAAVLGCQEILPVPYAHGLRPGAVVVGGGGVVLSVENVADGDGLRAYSSNPNEDYAAIWAVNSSMTGKGLGIYAYSVTGSAIKALSDSTTTPALHVKIANPANLAADFLGRTRTTANSSLYSGRVDNIGQGDGLRAISNTNSGLDWGAVYAYNTGSGAGVVGGSTAGWAGYMKGNLRVTGTCTGCSLSYPAQNTGTAALQPGDLVAVSGMGEIMSGSTTPIIQVSALTAENSGAVFGVVHSAGRLVIGEPKDGSQVDDIIPLAGPAAPGDYVFIVVHGLVQVRVPETSASFKVGDHLSVASLAEGLSLQAVEPGGSPSLGQVMESTPTDGLVWVMLDLR
jgi:hypothetical protein